jgi:hypothetical protein
MVTLWPTIGQNLAHLRSKGPIERSQILFRL